LGQIILRHEPQKLNADEFEIAGHLHPGATLVQRGVALHTKCFVSDANRIILPAFGRYTGAFDVGHKAFDGLYNKATANITMIGKASLHQFPITRVL
jgi:uncharacterized protein